MLCSLGKLCAAPCLHHRAPHVSRHKLTPLKFIDLFAGLGGFHLALRGLGHQCVFASEVDEELCAIYEKNFGMRPHGDIRSIRATKIPSHDVLCAGFPCQPFSKAGEQLGTDCELWGDLFESHVLRILRRHKPRYFLFENVANLERHDGGRTWSSMRDSLVKCGYKVSTKVMSPHRFGVPQIRERLFVVGHRGDLGHFEWPTEEPSEPSVCSVLDKCPAEARPLTEQVLNCLQVWQEFLDRSPKTLELPSFPIWAMEFGATYPFTKYDSLHDVPLRTLRNYRGSFGQSLNCWYRDDVLQRLPSYARYASNSFPIWKQQFIRQNRQFYNENKSWIKPWLPKLLEFPPSLQKFEWNCKGEDRDIWKYVLQFRASGVRVKRPTTAPSLVAMTTTQVPIIGWERRYMTPRECARLQSMDNLEHLPPSITHVHHALGNAVNVHLVRLLASRLLCGPELAAGKKAA